MSQKRREDSKKKLLERYETEIASSVLFSLDKEKQPTAYSREVRKMTNHLIEYLYAVDEAYYANFGVEIMKTIASCIGKYSSEKGQFLHYFRASIKTACVYATAEQKASERRGGLHITAKVKKLMPQVAKYLEKKGIDPDRIEEEQITFVADYFGQSEKVIRDVIEANQFSNVVYDKKTNVDGETLSVFDLISSGEAVDARLKTEEHCKEILNQIELAFSHCQERQKPLLSELLTARLCESEIFDDTDLHIAYSDYTFINKNVVREYILNHTIFSDAEIALKYEKYAESVSRTLKEFLAKVVRENFNG